MYHFKNPNSNVKDIRHVINPTISFGYTPDFTTNPDYFQKMHDPKIEDTTKVFYQDRYQGFVYGGSNPEEADQSVWSWKQP
jgi:hypothetical protein